MKKYIITSLLFFIPLISMASDHCTNPTEYTIDKRCYVTDKQKQQKPYNAVVALIDNRGIYCTGTLAKWGNTPFYNYGEDYSNELYLFTAKHCTDNDEDGKPDLYLRVRFQDGLETDVVLASYGGSWAERGGDWAMYYLPSPINLDTVKHVYADINSSKDGRSVAIVGYGSLKIMSDIEIKTFKRKYLNFLKEYGISYTGKGNEFSSTGIWDDGGIGTEGNRFKVFVEKYLEHNYASNLFFDSKLKVSNCIFDNDARCQVWNGNSGGPVFDQIFRLVGVLTSGWSAIGGADHGVVGSGILPTGYFFEYWQKVKKQIK